jgi:hypothetical protein
MRESVANVVRKYAASIPQFALSKALQQLMGVIGGSQWRKMSEEELYQSISSVAEQVKGHGLSLDAYDKFTSALDAASGNKQRMVSLATQYLLAGAGMKALKTATEFGFPRNGAPDKALLEYLEKTFGAAFTPEVEKKVEDFLDAIEKEINDYWDRS